MSSNGDNDAEGVTPWQPFWRRPPRAFDPKFTPDVLAALRKLDKFSNILDFCKLVDFPFRLPPDRELFDPAPAIERLERYRSDPTRESAAAARDAIVQYIRALPAEQDTLLAWESRFRERRMEEFLPDLVRRA